MHADALRQPLASLPDPLPIPTLPPGASFDLTLRPPGSKSITNRALLLAALADGTSTLRAPLTDADDAQVMIAALRALGARIEGAPSASSGADPHPFPSPAQPAPTPVSASPPPLPTLRITGVAGRWNIPRGQTIHLDLHNAGTATRFLTAAALLAPPGTSIIIDGDARMRERPIGELVEALHTLAGPAASITCPERPDCPPVHIRTASEPRHGPSPQPSRDIRFGRTQSSQFISAALLIAPWLPLGLIAAFDDAITSESYIDMTVALLRRLGARLTDDRAPARAIRIHPAPLRAFDLSIEPDASSATYFHAAAALFPGARTTITGLDLAPGRAPLQGDTHFVRILTAFGATAERITSGPDLSAALRITGPTTPARLRAIDADLSDMPDTAMTAAALACFAEPTPDNPGGDATTTLRGLRTLRIKETDRLAALQTELSRLGARVEILTDPATADESLRITPPPPASLRDPAAAPLVFSTYNDHRMAMALALIGLRRANTFIANPACVAKTYPTFWQDFARVFASRAPVT